MSTIVIVGSGMMGSALAFPARENGNTVRLVGSPLDGEIIDACRATNRHPKFAKQYIDLAPLLLQAFSAYAGDVRSGAYPAPEHEYN